MLSGRAFDELDILYINGDTMDRYIASEVGAGRNLRMMLLLNSALMNCTCDIAKYLSLCRTKGPASWKSTGINYQLTLFNEYAFQQVDFRGFVVVNNAHVRTILPFALSYILY